MLSDTETLDMTLLIDEAYKLGQMINDSQEVAEYLAAKERLEQDDEAQRLRRLFLQKKEQYEEVRRFGTYHPDFDRIAKEVREAKRALEMLDTVQAFKAAENRLDEMLYEIGRTIADAVSPTVKVPSNNPFLEAMSSGCGAGGSCGCGAKRG